MVEHIVVALEVDGAAVDGEAVDRLVHNPAPESPRAVNARRGRVGHIFRHTACRINQIVEAFALVDPRSLLVLGHGLVLSYLPVHLHLEISEGLRVAVAVNFAITVLERNHIVVELAVPEALVAPEKVGRAVIVDEYGRIDETETGRKRPSDGVLPRPLRVIGHCYCESISALLGTAAEIPVPLAVPFDGLGSPRTVPLSRPLESAGRNLCAEISPVHHILRAENQPVLHQEVGGVILIVIDKEIKLVTVNIWSGVRSINRADDGILGKERYSGHHSGQKSKSFLHFVFR